MYSHTGRQRLLQQRGTAAGRPLHSVSRSSRGHAYELNEHQIPAGMVQKLLDELKDQNRQTPTCEEDIIGETGEIQNDSLRNVNVRA